MGVGVLNVMINFQSTVHLKKYWHKWIMEKNRYVLRNLSKSRIDQEWGMPTPKCIQGSSYSRMNSTTASTKFAEKLSRTLPYGLTPEYSG